MYTDPVVQRSTMMGLPCVRLDGRFFASLDRRTQALLVKLPPARVGELIAHGVGEPFAPAGRVFREWVAIPQPDRERWQRLLTEARDHADPSTPATSPVTPADTTIFSGFSAAGLAFLARLERDNTKRYFDTHRRTYQQQLLEPCKTFVAALGAELRRRVSEGLHAEPRIGGSLSADHRDACRAVRQPPVGLTGRDARGEVRGRRVLLHEPAALHDPSQSPGKPLFSLDLQRCHRHQTLWMPINRPSWSGGVLVFVEDAVESVSPVDVQVSDLGWVGDRFGRRALRRGVGQGRCGRCPL
jgi:hypothetical protein